MAMAVGGTNVFVELLWKSVKYEEIYLHSHDTVSEVWQALPAISISAIAVARTQRLMGKPRIRLTSTSRRSPQWLNSQRKPNICPAARGHL